MSVERDLAGAVMEAVPFPPMPSCPCHGLEVGHVHSDGGHAAPAGRDEAHGWAWHCPLDDCDGYPVVLPMPGEWLGREAQAVVDYFVTAAMDQYMREEIP